MRAVVLRGHGGVDRLAVEEVPLPEIGPGEVLLKVRAVGVSRTLDLLVREDGGGFPIRLPLIPGNDPVGEIVEVGPQVVGVQPGQAVIAFGLLACRECDWCTAGFQPRCAQRRLLGVHLDGGYAEYLKLPAWSVIPKPPNLSFEEATALAVTYTCAWHLLVTRARVRPTDTVLVQSVGGALAQAGLQIARLHGARVIATAGSDAKLERARELGADAIINYRNQDVVEAVKELTGGRGVELVFDNVGAETFGQSMTSAAMGGRLAVAGAHAGRVAEVNLRSFYSRHLSLLGSASGSYADTRTVTRLAAEGRLKPIVDSVYPLEQVAEAQHHMEQRINFGKVVLAP